MNQMPYIFQFEKDDTRFSALEWIPFAIRYHLDDLGKKLSLGAWQSFPLDVRTKLQELSTSELPNTSSSFNEALLSANILYNGSPLKDFSIETSIWEKPTSVPAYIIEQCSNYNVAISTEQWANLPTFIRYVFHKATTGRDGSILQKLLRELHCME